MRVHASCVWWPIGGVLLRGGSGSGKTDLAWRLIEESGAILIGDDQVELSLRDGALTATACVPGLIEVRGLGLVGAPYQPHGGVCLVVDLADEMPRMPKPRYENLLGVDVPCLSLLSFDANAARRVHLAVRTIGKNGFPEDGIIPHDCATGIASGVTKGHSDDNRES